MTFRGALDDDWDDDLEADAEGDEADDEAAVIACPHCGTEVYEDAERCPHCQEYISDEDAPPARKAWWIVAGATAVLYAVYRWTVG